MAMARLPRRCVRAEMPRKIPSSAATGIDQTKPAGGFGQKQKVTAPKTPLKPAKNRARQASVCPDESFAGGTVGKPSSGLFTPRQTRRVMKLSLIHISEPTR